MRQSRWPQRGRPSRRAAAWLRWSGGALAASVAAVALFVARQHLGGASRKRLLDAPRAATTMPAAAETVADAGDVAAPGVSTAAEAVAAASAPLVAAASSRQVADGLRRGSATRNQQAARRVVAVREEPRMVANAAALPGYTMPEATAASPFAPPSALRAKPWPRSVLGTATDHPFSASVQVGEGADGRSIRSSRTCRPPASRVRPITPRSVDRHPGRLRTCRDPFRTARSGFRPDHALAVPRVRSPWPDASL
jgi:hypothetical protein